MSVYVCVCAYVRMCVCVCVFMGSDRGICECVRPPHRCFAVFSVLVLSLTPADNIRRERCQIKKLSWFFFFFTC